MSMYYAALNVSVSSDEIVLNVDCVSVYIRILCISLSICLCIVHSKYV